MRFLLFLPALFFFSLGIIGAVSRSRREARQWQEAEAVRIAKAEAAARARLIHNAPKTVCTAAAPSQPKRKRGRPRKTPAAPPRQPKQPDPVQPVPEQRPATVSESAQLFRGNNVFAGQVVAFTGMVQDMTRAEAIQAVWDNGGKAFDAITADTTLLIVGANPAASELALFPQLPRITADHFKFRLAAPLTVSPDEFANAFA